MKIKAGYKSVELWAGLLSTVLFSIFPAFSQSAFLSIISWVGGRSAQKMFGLVDPLIDKASWQTSEFWVSIAYSILVTIFPDIPQEALYVVMGWITSRTMIKLTTATRNNI